MSCHAPNSNDQNRIRKAGTQEKKMPVRNASYRVALRFGYWDLFGNWDSQFWIFYRSLLCLLFCQRLRIAGANAILAHQNGGSGSPHHPEDAQLARRKRRIIVIGSLVLVLAFLFGIFGRKPASQAIRGWQAQRHAKKASASTKLGATQWCDDLTISIAVTRPFLSVWCCATAS